MLAFQRDFFVLLVLSFSTSILGGGCGFRCLLSQLPIALPDVRTGDLSLTTIVCRGIDLSSATASDAVAPLSIRVDASVSSVCGFGFSLDNGVAGTATAFLNTSRASFLVKVVTSDDGIPESVTTSDCSVEISSASLLSVSPPEAEPRISPHLHSLFAESSCLGISGAGASLSSSMLDLSKTIRQFSKMQPPPPVEPPAPDCTANLRSSPIVGALDYFVDDLAGPDAVSWVVDKETNTTGSFMWKNLTGNNRIGGLFSGYGIKWNSGIFYEFSDMGLQDADSWRVFEVLETEPRDNYTIVSMIGLDKLGINATWHVDAVMNHASGDPIGTYHQFGNVLLGFSDLRLQVRTRLFINETHIEILGVPQLADPNCLVRSIAGVEVQQFQVNSTSARGAFVLAGGDIEPDLQQFAQTVSRFVSSAYSSHLVGLVNGVYVPTFLESLRFVLNTLLMNDFPCKVGPKEPPAPALDVHWAINALAAAGCASFGLIIAALALAPSPATRAKDAEEQAESQPLTKSQSSPQRAVGLVHNPKIPFFARVLVPVVICFNAALFVMSLTSTGVTLSPLITLGGGHEIDVGSLRDFSLVNSVSDMWAGRAYVLAVVILLFSGVWPFTKLVLMLGCWMLPPKIIGRRKRELVLMAVDSLGKWSFADIFCEVIMASAFHFTVHVDPPARSPSSRTTAELFVEARVGFILFVLATTLSMVAGHVLIALHRHAEASPRIGDRHPLEDEKVPMRLLAWKNRKWSQGTLSLARASMPVLLVLSVCLVCAGASFHALEYNIKGLAGWMLSLMGQSSAVNRRFSLIDLAEGMPKASRNPMGVAPVMTEVIVFSTAFGIPILQLFVMIFLWLAPLKLAWQQWTFVVAEVLNAWSALEVFVVACLASLLTSFNSDCGPISPVIERYLVPNPLPKNLCFLVLPHGESGLWLFISCCATYLISSVAVMRTCHSALCERQKMIQAVQVVN